MTVQLLHGDCLELMKTLPDKSIDLFICDLPYGCLSAKRGGKRVGKCEEGKPNSNIIIENKPCDWDVKLDLEAFWTQVKRLCKNDHTPVIHFCNTRFGAELIASNPSWFRYDLVWSKSNGVGFLSANKQPLRSHENIYIFSKKGAYYKRIDDTGKRCVKSVIEVANKKGKGNHPTQKPLELYTWLISRYCPDGGTVLDPTAGSFNSGLVCKELGLNYVGIEKDDTFYEKGVEKFEPKA